MVFKLINRLAQILEHAAILNRRGHPMVLWPRGRRSYSRQSQATIQN